MKRRWKKDGIRMLLLVVCGGNLEMKSMFFGRCKKRGRLSKVGI